MEIINDTKAYPISEWEDAVKDRADISFEGMHLKRGLVIGAYGVVVCGGIEYAVRWLYNGLCYYRGVRARKWDIKLE